METEIDPIVDSPELAKIVNQIAREAGRDDKEGSGIVLSREECRLLWEYLQTPGHGFWKRKAKDEE